ncbi:MAG: hypothetical protein M1838_000933 [Thelocarpon superellum]|nr:MAG: hypothetical protein M1838_000933 [Thelocarpon superellum]
MSSKKPFKSQASSGRASLGLGVGRGSSGFGAPPTFGAASILSYISDPPELSAISAPNVVVSFKNLSKKDATTKAKALEELQTYLASLSPAAGGVEDGFLEAWGKVYPRTSIDGSRRVRQLAHNLQGQIVVVSGKRFARQMPKIIGAWLSGLYDSDRPVARAAQEALEQAFPAKEKIQGLWRAYQRPLLEYARDAILRETVLTLSDERTVAPDDAEAKHARVVGTGASLLSNLLQLDDDLLAKEQSLRREIVTDEGLWAFASHQDPFVRRAIYRLLRTCLAKDSGSMTSILKVLSTEMLAKSLNIAQSGSARDYSDTLAALTGTFPLVWTDAYTAKTPATLRLRQFIRRGSQGGPAEVWENTSRIIVYAPSELLPREASRRIEFLDDVRDGINKKDEPRGNLPTAWAAYCRVLRQFLTLSSVDDQRQLVKKGLFPIVEQYVRPSTEDTRWSGATYTSSICVLALRSVDATETTRDIVEQGWSRMADGLVHDINTSSSEQSKEFGFSQKLVAEEGSRWAALSGDVYGNASGAAAVLEALLRRIPAALLKDPEFREPLSAFFVDDVPSLSSTASFPMLASCLRALSLPSDQAQIFQRSFRATVTAILTTASFEDQLRRLQILLTALDPSSRVEIDPESGLEDFVIRAFRKTLHDEAQGWGFIKTALSYGTCILSNQTVKLIMTELSNGLTAEDDPIIALKGLELILQSSEELLKLSGIDTSDLLSRLLALTESTDEDIVVHAQTVSHLVESILSHSHGAMVHDSMVGIIQRELSFPHTISVSFQSLVDRAEKLYAASADQSRAAADLLPSGEQWQAALAPFLATVPEPCLAITDILGGSLYLARGKSADSPLGSSRDQDGYAAALRIGMYANKLIRSTSIFGKLGPEEQSSLCQDLLLTVQLASDTISLLGSNKLWVPSGASHDLEEEVLKFVSEAQTLITTWLQEQDGVIDNAQRQLQASSSGRSPRAFYHARAFAYLTEARTELQGSSKSDTDLWADQLKAARKQPEEIYRSTSLLIGNRGLMSGTKTANRLCNEIVSDLTVLQYATDPDEAVRLLVLLNAIIQYQETASEIPRQRLVPLVKRLMEWWNQEDIDPAQSLLSSSAATSEVAKVLLVLVPVIQDVYGSHWSQIVDFIGQTWAGSGVSEPVIRRLPAIHASLRLFAAVRKVRSANDDVDDAWTEMDLPSKLIQLLKTMPKSVSDDSNQPLKAVNGLLARQLSDCAPENVDDLTQLYHLVYAESLSLQEAAYGLLHRLIPNAQQEISVEAALTTSTVHLSQELLSLILEAPTLAMFAETSWQRSVPLSLRGYLLSWLLVFDHFVTSSYKVRSDYVADLQQGNYLYGLLDFTFAFLGHDKGKAVNASRLTTTSYTLDSEESPKRDAQWMLIHLYYLCLKHLPSLTKAWWIDCTGRGKAASIETWTEKYISPHVIADELGTVSTWASEAASRGDEDGPLSVKVSKTTREIMVGYDVDEQMMQIAIKLPGAYPLRQAMVEGINRVGVDEKKWRSWLINAQGVITFSNGSIVDGLIAWRKNVEGAMKGQTECAICYSIISADKQLPSKRCSTCKNLFHSSCLFKWFKSSNSSSCPLCRNPFNYG